MTVEQIAEVRAKYVVDTSLNSVPGGYQQSEVGLIPSEWEVLTINDVAEFSGGSQPPKNTFSAVPKAGYIRLIQIRDYKTSDYETFIPEHLARKKCSAKDIMIGRYGPPIFQILRGIEGAYNVALIKASPKKNITRDYLFYCLKSEKLFELMDMLSQRSSGQTGVELPALKAYPIPLPPIHEQTAIANALSDVDALIQELEKLIAKKQAIKTATMQQLLTGRTRLPQFAHQPDGRKKGYKPSELGEIPEDWEVGAIGDSCRTYSGGTPSTSNKTFYGGDIKWITSSDLNQGVIHDVAGRITDAGLSGSSAKLVEADTLLIALYGATAGVCAITRITAAINQAVLAIVPEEHNSEYLFYWLTRHKDLIIETYTQGGQPNLSGDIVRTIKLAFPPVKEQVVIATTLSEMDKEIQALEQRLNKTSQIKQGMMQELLTGKTRLVKPAGAA